jgi:Large ribosomal RNA subunit accumulation protein YceD
MPERRSEPTTPVPWHVPVALEHIAETGQHLDLTANVGVRKAVAKVAGLRDLPRLEASFDVTRRGAALHVSGRVFATVGQNCVVTLEPLANDIEETINLLFEPVNAPKDSGDDGDRKPRDVKWSDPEPLVDGVVDLGALATEFLILGLDPYPRKAGAVFEAPQELTRDGGPFAALAKLAKD